MNRSSFIKHSKYGILPAALFCVPIIFFIRDEQFSQAWLLYLGNALFLTCIFIFVLTRPKTGGEKISPLNAGFSATFAGIMFSIILTIICILIFAPGLFDIGANQVLRDTPPSLTSNYDHGVLLMLLADIVVGNVVAGSFASVMASASMRRNKDDMP